MLADRIAERAERAPRRASGPHDRLLVPCRSDGELSLSRNAGRPRTSNGRAALAPGEGAATPGHHCRNESKQFAGLQIKHRDNSLIINRIWALIHWGI